MGMLDVELVGRRGDLLVVETSTDDRRVAAAMLLEPAIRLIAARDFVAAVEDPRRREELAVLAAVGVAHVHPVVGVETRVRELHEPVRRGGLARPCRRDVEDAPAVLRDHRPVDRVDAVVDRELAADRTEDP